ncbi:hypothetical protein [Taibaiella chishuiensis]|uniref:Uncharacterized protein n=1 Tax=Taibaiella chishuiensis TaxID=1434707 RepID=A0A2P8DBK3_9BACT|nr:hypothetical protein [Taibaiella chishuiensis]PSK94557.1 hypothetical protein B0I18_101713 [Taibaiella chishuiensis]
MTRKLFSTALLWLICSILVFFCFLIVASAQELKPRPAHVGIIYPLSTNGTEAPECSNRFSLHLLSGVSRNETAFCLSGISGVVRQNAQGLMLSGITNIVGDKARGAQVAGILNLARKATEGAAIAGIVNITADMRGAQVAGFANIVRDAEGAQVAGFINKARTADAQVAGFANLAQRSDAVQIAGFVNVSAQGAGSQVAGFANLAGKTQGVQVAGFGNLSRSDAGSQVAGLINIARKVKGVQVAGLINIAEESDYPIGLINIIKNGERQIGASIDESGVSMLTFRSGGRYLYGILGAGYNFKEDNARYALEGGIGFHIPLARYFRANVEMTAGALSDLKHNVYYKSGLRVLAAYKVANRIEFFAGPSINNLSYERDQDDIRDHYLWQHKGRNSINGIYIGGIAGIQVNL